MTRASAEECASRVNAAANALAAGEPHSAVVANAMAQYGVSRRQAQRIVAAGAAAMVRDVAGDGEPMLLGGAGVIHQTLATLQRAAQVALEAEKPQPAAAVNAARAIIALTELAHRVAEVDAIQAVTRKERRAMIEEHEAWEGECSD
jgi:hypothetical protein